MGSQAALITARDLDPLGYPDPFRYRPPDRSRSHEPRLSAVDTGDGLTQEDRQVFPNSCIRGG